MHPDLLSGCIPKLRDQLFSTSQDLSRLCFESDTDHTGRVPLSGLLYNLPRTLFPPWFHDDISVIVILCSNEKRLAASRTIAWSTPGTLTGGKGPAFA
eukprot:scaffold140361_cov59-Attheya_sp.AAC.2